MNGRETILKIAVIGAGVRGTSLARKLVTSGTGVRIVAVAEPDASRRDAFSLEFGVPSSGVFKSWEELTAGVKDCDGAVIATLDNQHTGPALACLGKGWHILLEKPLADTLDDCKRIASAQAVSGKVVAVCHTLRFMEGFRKVRELITGGRIGRLVHIEHMEAIGHLRFAHNYVRGRWASEKNNTFLLLHKCSHDIDYLCWLFSEPCLRVSSFGSLSYFKPANAPAGSTLRCTDGCSAERVCAYSALRIYVEGDTGSWPARDISPAHDRETHLEAVRKGPYGKCVWHAGNDVVDHQVVMLEYRDGSTATCTLSGYSASNGRRLRLQGTEGEILFEEAEGTITCRRFFETQTETIKISAPAEYHPEDQDIANEWLSSVINSTAVTVDAGEALRTHAVVFAAELSRHESRTVEMTELL